MVCRIFYRCVDWNMCSNILLLIYLVASFTDAWIETDWLPSPGGIAKSHLLQMRGLKPKLGLVQLISTRRIFYRCVDWNKVEATIIKYSSVASFTDAWIETGFSLYLFGYFLCRIFYRCVDWNLVALVSSAVNVSRIFYRCVDWNNIRGSNRQTGNVASFTDAWIETVNKSPGWIYRSRIFYRCVDWNLYFHLKSDR